MKSIATALVVLSVFFIQEASGLPLRHLRSVDASASTSDKAGVQAIGLRKDDNAVNAGDAFKHLANWILSEGGGASDGMLGKMTQHAGAEFRGVVASRSVDYKEYLLNLPKKLWIHLDNFPALRDTALPKAKCSSLDDISQSRIRLAAATALESKRGPKSFYYEYLSALPSRQDFKSFMPIFMEDGLKRNFTGLPLVAIAVELQRVDHNENEPCFMEWKRMPESPVADLNWDDVHLALMQIRTRSYDVSGAIALIPGSDMLNTATGSDINTFWDNDEDEFRLHSTSDVAEGLELYETYCTSCDNTNMLATYGVYLEDNEVKVDSAEADCEKHQNGTLRHSMESTLDMKKSMALASDLRNPRAAFCRQEVFSAEQGPLQCSLARLTWEYCAESWGLARKSMSFLQTGKVVTAPPLSPREKAMRVLRSSRGAWGGVPEKVTDARST